MSQNKPARAAHPLVSVVIPNYNHAQFVADAIQSVLDQAYRNFEIIVVDDGSTDNSREVVAQFGDQVRYIWQENQGLSAARNTGIRAARGHFVGVLDADDMYEPEFLDTLVSILEATPEADGVYCGYQFVDQENNLLPQIEARSFPADELHGALLDGNFLVPESMFVRIYCYADSEPFDVSLTACEDWDMWLRFTKKYKIIHTTKILTRHRILAGSMSTNPLRMLHNRLAVLKKHVGDEPLHGEEDVAKRKAYGRAYLGSCVEYLQYGDNDRAFYCLQKMANICPDLLEQVDTFYLLGCGDQPKGSMGDLDSLDVNCNSQTLIFLLDYLLRNANTSAQVKHRSRTAYATAYFALGILGYGARDFRGARRFFMRAATSDPKIMRNRRFISTFLKSLLGTGIVERLKISRQRLSASVD